MKLVKLEVQNFLSIGELSLNLKDRGLCLIQGVNKDDDSSDSNGAGKSSILNAISYALYGVCANGMSGDSVVNKVAKKNCRVSLFIEDGDHSYSIHRFRKDNLEKNQTFVYQETAGDSIEISKGTEKETQAVINTFMGCSLDVFLASVYASQENMVDLPLLTDKNLKVLIEEAAGIDILASAYEEAKRRSLEQGKLTEFCNNELQHASKYLIESKSNLSELGQKSALFDADKPARVKVIFDKASEVVTAIRLLANEIAAIDANSINLEISNLTSKINGIKGEQIELERLSSKASDLLVKSIIARRVVDGFIKSSAQIETNISNANEMIGKDCKECGKTHTRKDLAKYLETQASALESNELQLITVKSDHEVTLKVATDALRAFESYKATMSDVSGLIKSKDDLVATLHKRETMVLDRQRMTEMVKDAVKKTDAIKTEVSPFNEMIKTYTEKVVVCEEVEQKWNKSYNQSLEAEEVAKMAEKVFGPSGVRAHILDTVTPYLNERTSYYLSTLTDGAINATWQTLTRNAKGDYREKFSIDVSNKFGAESFAGLSGGEKRKVRLATGLALQDLVSTRAIKPIDLMMYDEIDAALDDAGLQRLFEVLNERAKNASTVFIVSHTDLKSYVPNSITIEKEGGFSKLVDNS